MKEKRDKKMLKRRWSSGVGLRVKDEEEEDESSLEEILREEEAEALGLRTLEPPALLHGSGLEFTYRRHLRRPRTRHVHW